MDPLSITATVFTLIGATTEIIKYLENVRHQRADARAFAEEFDQIKHELESLYARLDYIEKHNALPAATPSSLCAHQQHADMYRRAGAMGERGEKLKSRLSTLCKELQTNGRSRFENFKAGVTWSRRKEHVKEEQRSIIAEIRRIRDVLSDDQAEQQQQSNQMLRGLEYDNDRKRNIEILNWIYADTLDAPLHPASALALENTGFVRSDDIYTQWHQDKSWQLNCFGKSGAGKSIRAQAVLKDLHDRYYRHAIPILSLFFNYKNKARQRLDLVLCSLLRQLITKRRPIKIPQGVLDAWQNSQYVGKRPLNEGEARNLLRQALDEDEPIFLVIDALDEAEGCMEALHTEIRWLRNYRVCIFSTEVHEQRILNDSAFCYRHQVGPGPFERLVLYWQCKKCHGPLGMGIQICQDCFVRKKLTCDDPDHVLKPPGRIHVEVIASSRDVQRFAERYLEDAMSGGDVGDDDYMFSGHRPLLAIIKADFDTHMWSEIPAKVAQAANGNFLHAQLFLERLKEQRHRDGALSLLKQLQLGSLPDIEGQYHEKLVRCLQGSGAQVARDHFNIVAAAVEVLEYDQLTHAAAVIAGDETLSDFAGRCCSMEIVRQDTAGLLSIDPKGQTETFVVGFSHRAFSVYVDKHPDMTFPDAKQRMSDACLAYLSLNPFTKPFAGSLELDATLQDYPFATYAACYWGLHAQYIEQSVGNSVRILAFLNDTERLNCAIQVAWRAPSMPISAWDISGGITPLHACAFYGLETICALLVSVLPGVDPVEETYHQTPLIYACRQGHVEIVRLLLKAGANPNHVTKRARSPLIEAIESGQQDVFQLLLMQDCLDINLSHTGKNGRPPLVRAAALGNENMVAMLLKRPDLLVNGVDGYNCSALSRAVQTLQIGCVRQLLLCDDTDLSLRDTEGDRTALDWLAGETLDYQQDADKIHVLAAMLMNDHRAPLPSDHAIISAIGQGKEELLQIYIQGNLNHLYTDDFGRNFLHLAATEGVCSIVTLFHSRLAKEAAFDIDMLDQYRATALHAVCSRLTEKSFAHVDTIKFLLDAGANPSLIDDQGRTPAMRARRASQPLWESHVSALFASNKSDVLEDVGGAGSDTLEMALRTAKVDAFKTALDQLPDPISPEIAHYSSSTILHHAMGLQKDFRREVLQLLVPRSKIFLSDTDADGQTCAHLAVKQNSLETLRFLCEAGIDINIRDRWKLTPFELAQRWQRFEFCVYLASKGAFLPSGATIRPDILRAAIEDGDLKAVERLIDAGVDTNFRDVVKGLNNIQRAQELREVAVNASRDELLAKNDKSTQTDLETWNKHKYSAPEVGKRDAIFRLMQKLQDKTWSSGGDTQAESNQALTELLEKLKKMDPGTTLCVSEVGNILEKTSTSNKLPALAHAQQSMDPNVASAVTSSMTYNLGEGVVTVAIAIVLGIVAIFIAWIVSSTRAH